MQVEFVSTEHDGLALYIAASEFKKAEKSGAEFTSLGLAVDAFSRLFNEEYHITMEEYKALNGRLEKGESVVIFPREENRYTWFEMCVTKGNFKDTIVYEDENGEHRIKRFANITKQSLASIKKK